MQPPMLKPMSFTRLMEHCALLFGGKMEGDICLSPYADSKTSGISTHILVSSRGQIECSGYKGSFCVVSGISNVEGSREEDIMLRVTQARSYCSSLLISRRTPPC